MMIGSIAALRVIGEIPPGHIEDSLKETLQLHQQYNPEEAFRIESQVYAIADDDDATYFLLYDFYGGFRWINMAYCRPIN